jgi:hypothetical protein
MNKRLTITLGSAALALITAWAPAGANELLRFQVYLDDKPIGEHSFRIAEGADSTRVSSRAAFDVDFLFINAYRYRHNSNEVFRDGCLAEIDANTDDNGKRFQVEGTSVGDGLRIERTDGVEQAPGCIKTFAYWDRSFLDQSRLLNPQTGDIEKVRVQRKGSDRVEVEDGRKVPAQRYALMTDELTIDVWYNDDLGWVGLESDTGKGRRIIYKRM